MSANATVSNKGITVSKTIRKKSRGKRELANLLASACWKADEAHPNMTRALIKAGRFRGFKRIIVTHEVAVKTSVATQTEDEEDEPVEHATISHREITNKVIEISDDEDHEDEDDAASCATTEPYSPSELNVPQMPPAPASSPVNVSIPTSSSAFTSIMRNAQGIPIASVSSTYVPPPGANLVRIPIPLGPLFSVPAPVPSAPHPSTPPRRVQRPSTPTAPRKSLYTANPFF